MGFDLKRGLRAIATGGISEVGRALKGGGMPDGNFGAQLEADKQNALFNFKLNNNISNPFGSQSVISDGNGGWKTNVSYSAPIQSAISGYQGMLPGMQQRIASTLSRPSSFDVSDPNYRQRIQDAMLSRMDFAGDEESLRTRLANQGLTEGSEGWNKEMLSFRQGTNDARMQAFLGSGQEMQNLFNMDQAGRMAPINEMNAVTQSMYGLAPQFQQFQSNYSLTNPAKEQYGQDLDQYNAKQARNNQIMGGLFQLGGSAIMASDRRLKSNIVRVGEHPLGIGVYEYDIGGQRQRGVMAQEVMEVKPEAVLQHPAGYLMVNYGML